MITIDAQGKTLGRVASAAAKVLLGKNLTTFTKNTAEGEEVKITNASKVELSGSKKKGKTYVRFSGYPGGQKIENYERLTERRGYEEAIRRAVKGMLPKNRLQTPRMKRLTIEK